MPSHTGAETKSSHTTQVPRPTSLAPRPHTHARTHTHIFHHTPPLIAPGEHSSPPCHHTAAVTAGAVTRPPSTAGIQAWPPQALPATCHRTPPLIDPGEQSSPPCHHTAAVTAGAVTRPPFTAGIQAWPPRALPATCQHMPPQSNISGAPSTKPTGSNI